MKRIIALLTATMLIFGCFAGCGKKNETNTPTGSKTPQKAKTIRFLNFKPEIASVYNEIAKAYEQETGVKVIVSTAANNTYESTLSAKMATAEAPTIFQINGPRGYASWKDYCADLKNTKLYEHLTDKNLAVKEGDGVYGIPYVVEGYGIIYNNAIMEKYFALQNKKVNINSAAEIKNFETLKAVAEDMQSKKAELGIDGVFASTSLKPGDDWRWQTHLANIPIYYEFKNKNINLTSAETKKITFEYSREYKNIFDLYIHNSVTDPKKLGSKITDESMAEFALGKCAMVQNGNWAWKQISTVKGNVVKSEDIKFLPIYTGMDNDEKQGLCIGTENYFCINSKASKEEQEAAADFLYWLYSSETGKKFVTEKLDFIAPFDTFGESERPNDPLAKEVIRWMNDKNVTSVPWNFTLFPSQTFKNDFGAALLQYAQGTKKWDTVKKEVVDKWASESAALA